MAATDETIDALQKRVIELENENRTLLKHSVELEEPRAQNVMLSRLSGLANVVLHELSGDDSDQNMTTQLETESPQERDMEVNKIQEDILHRLADAENLIVELKDVIRQKDVQLQEKEEALQEEKQSSENKMTKMKLHAKAKITVLNKQIEEMKAQGWAAQPGEPQTEPLSKHDKISTEYEMEFEKIKHELQEKEQLINNLQAQLTKSQSEQAAQLDKHSAELNEFSMLKQQQLEEKEKVINTLKKQLSQTQAEQMAQQVVREKDARFETQVRLHEDELLQLVTQADVETEMQQKLKILQRKLEEHEEALFGRSQVVDLLQQELTAAEQRNQDLSQQLQQLEAEHNTLKNTIETEREESKLLMEKMELEVAERKLSFHNLQEEMHHVLGQLEKASQAQAELQFQYSASEQKYKADMEEKTTHIMNLQKTERELQSACDTLKEENSKLLQEKNEQAAQSTQAIQQLEDQLQQKSNEISQFFNKPALQKQETASQTTLPDYYNEGTQISPTDTTILNSSNFTTGEGGQDVLEISFSQKHKELSILLIEMEEAQKEIAFLKSQLQEKRTEGDYGVLDHKEVKEIQSEGTPPVKMEDFPLMSNEENSIVAVEKEEHANMEHPHEISEKMSLGDTGKEFKPTKQDNINNSPSVPNIAQDHQVELERLNSQILGLETSFQKAEKTYEKNLDEKTKEINNLAQIIEEFKNNARDTECTVTALCEEKEQLLSRLEELNVLAELRVQVKELETNLKEVEKERNLDYESHRTQHNMLTEKMHTLSTEAKSKDVKIEALQRDLDDLQLQFYEQGTLIKSLQSQLQEKEREVLEGAKHVRDISSKMEELSCVLTQKELEIAKMDQLLIEKKKDVEMLQQTIQEKDQQMTELSFNMTEKMVQLDKEKFSLGVEIKTLKEQLNLLSRAEEAKKEQAENKDIISGLKHSYDEPSPTGLLSKEELQHELDNLKKESDLRKKKLQAALINRKELLQKVSTLEEELAKVRDESRKEVPLSESGGKKLEESKEGKDDTEKCVISKWQELETSLKQSISQKEEELERVRKDLKEKIEVEEQFKAAIQKMTQTLQDRNNQIDSLQAEIIENQVVIHKLTLSSKDAGDGDSTTPLRESVASSPPDVGSGEHKKAELEEKIAGLENEKEKLQRSLEEALASGEVILKKAQEKEKHLVEELKQQRVDHNCLKEQFDKQRKENENIEEQLRQLQIQVASIHREHPDTDQQEPGPPTRDLEEALFEGIEQQPIQLISESGLGPVYPSHPGDADTSQVNAFIAQIKAQLKKIKAEKEVIESKIGTATNELAKKSEEIVQLNEMISKQGLEIQNLKAISHEAETHAELLKQELESSQLKISDLEHLKTLQPELDELQKHIHQKEEVVNCLSGQLNEKEEILIKVQSEIMEQENLIKILRTQLEIQAKEHEERTKQFQVELCELKQKPQEISEEEAKAKQQIQRKLQAALISRREFLKENKNLQEELTMAKDSIEHLTTSLADVESQVSAQMKEKETFLERLTLLQEERDKLIIKVDKSLLENQSLSGSCESLKLALEGLTEDNKILVKEIESLKCSKISESAEWQEKHKELQKEYEILLQSYENISNEAERMQHVVENVRQEKQELHGKLRTIEANKKETEKQLQESKQEIEEMKEKMRKFAKIKQQKIVDLEEENERLRMEAHPADDKDTTKEQIEALLTSNSSMKKELERTQSEYKTLSKEFEDLVSEKNILSEEFQDLKRQVESNICKQTSLETAEKHDTGKDVVEETTQTAEEQGSPYMNVDHDHSEALPSENSAKAGFSEDFSSHDDIHNYLEQFEQLKGRIIELEMEKEKGEELNQALENEKNALISQISLKDSELQMLQQEVSKINLLNQQIQEELSRVTKLKETAEEEKDDLEEKLMNQLAELNGSIGNYYQDITDAQIKNEQLESEMQNLKKYMSELEEEKQQLVKEKSKVESEIRKEYLENVQGAQKEPGNKSLAVELQELLKEKRHEVKQLQKDCLGYQEKISDLERTIKTLEFVQIESQKELDITKDSLAQAIDHRKNAQAELSSFKVLLDDTQSEAARLLTDNLKLKRELQSNEESIKSQISQKDEDLERRLEQQEEKHLKEKKNMQEKLDALYKEKIHLEETLETIQDTLNKKDGEVKQVQESLDNTVAQLLTFTKSMSSLQDDRDRMIDEVKKWERKFDNTIQAKEEEIKFKEENCSALKDQLRQMSIHVEELKINISSLEHDKQIWESKAQTEIQNWQQICDTLQGENKELLSQIEDTKQLHLNSQNELAKLESELKLAREQSTDLNDSLEKCKEHEESLEQIIKQQQSDIQSYKLSCEQLESDLKASEELTGKLHEEINVKEQKIMNLLSGKEAAIQAIIADLKDQHDKKIRALENLLCQEEEENKKAVDKTNELMEALKTIKKENMQRKLQLDSFIKSMSALQDDRDHIVSDYQLLESRHLTIILEKDQLIQDAAAENNKLKEEIRGLKSHIDDLNSKNSKLDAELIQYRKDLNQMISIKDCQQKQLLEAQLQQNKELKNECTKLEEKLKESEGTNEDLQRTSSVLQKEKQSLSQEIESLNGSISHLKRQVAALQEEGTLGIYHAQLKIKEEEVHRLTVTLSSSQKRITELEEKLICVQNEATRKVDEMEEKLKKELKHLHHDAGIMRNETETAEERVAELAKDLVEMEQKLLVVTKEKNDLMVQIQSFRKSMSSLQDSRDHAHEELCELRKKYDASLKELSQLQEERGILRRENEAPSPATLPLNDTENSSSSHLEKLNHQQLLHLSSPPQESDNQVQSYSKVTTSSRENEKDHRWSELEKFQKSEEEKQRAAAQRVSSPAEVQTLKTAMSSLQNDRDRLLKELTNLQQQYLQINQEITDLRPLKAQLQEYQDKTETFQIIHEELRQENLSWQHELQQLRMEKNSWDLHRKRMKEQYLMAVSDKDQQLNHLQSLLRELTSSSQTQTLTTQHERQLLEDKNSPSVQLSDTSESLHENQQHCSDLYNHYAVLELQDLRAESLSVAPGAPQKKNAVHKIDVEVLKEPLLSHSEAQHQQCNTSQEVDELKKLLQEERDQRLAAENALSMAEEQIRRLEHTEWESARTPLIGGCGSQEQSVLIDIESSSCRRTRSNAGWKRVLRSFCYSRTRVPLLATIYFLIVHALLILCFTGHL